MIPSWSRSHCTADPVTAIDPSSAKIVFAAHPVAHRRQQPRLRRDDLRAGVEQHEVAGAVGVLGFAGADAHLADGRGLLIAEVARDRDFAADRAVASRDAERLRGPTTPGSRAASRAEC